MAPITDLFSQFLVKRLHENNAFGIWMHVSRDCQDDMYHMANVLLIDSENFERALTISSLTSADGSRLRFKDWPKIFGLSMEADIYTPRDVNGHPTRIQMFRFVLSETDLVRPYTTESEEAIKIYFDNLQKQYRSKRSSRLRDNELVSFIQEEEIRRKRLQQDKENELEDELEQVKAENISCGDSDIEILFFNADEATQSAIVRKYIAMKKKKAGRVSKLQMTAGGHTMTWWKFPRNQVDADYQLFLRNISKDALAELVTYICRDQSLGVTHFSRLLKTIDSEAWAKGISEDMLTSDALMTPAKTYAAQIKTNSTDRQRRTWATILREHFGVSVSCNYFIILAIIIYLFY